MSLLRLTAWAHRDSCLWKLGISALVTGRAIVQLRTHDKSWLSWRRLDAPESTLSWRKGLVPISQPQTRGQRPWCRRPERLAGAQLCSSSGSSSCWAPFPYDRAPHGSPGQPDLEPRKEKGAFTSLQSVLKCCEQSWAPPNSRRVPSRQTSIFRKRELPLGALGDPTD